MFRYAFSIVSLQTFLVSRRRKVWFVLRAAALGLLVIFAADLAAMPGIAQEAVLLVGVYLASSVVLDGIRLFVITSYRRRIAIPLGTQDNFIMGMDALASLLTVLIVAGSIFPIFGIPFTNFITSLSLFSVAAAWLFKEYFANFFDSFRLMFSNDFLLGDYIKCSDTTKGVITDISFRATKVKTDEGDVLFIPNSTLMNTEVVNYSKAKYKRVTVRFALATDLLHDFNAFETYLTNTMIETFPDLFELEKVFLRIVEVDNGKTQCAFEVAVDRFNFTIENNIHKAVYKTVLRFQREQGNRTDTA